MSFCLCVAHVHLFNSVFTCAAQCSVRDVGCQQCLCHIRRWNQVSVYMSDLYSFTILVGIVKIEGMSLCLYKIKVFRCVAIHVASCCDYKGLSKVRL